MNVNYKLSHADIVFNLRGLMQKINAWFQINPTPSFAMYQLSAVLINKTQKCK